MIKRRLSEYLKFLKSLIKTICYKYKLPYFTITPTFSVCPSCGYIAGEHEFCTKCDSQCEVYSRVVGYLRPVKQWNKGKRSEFSMRKTYKINDNIQTTQEMSL